MAAVFDALMQDEDMSKDLDDAVITVIEQRLASDRLQTAAKTAATKVDFFTLVRGEDDC